MGPIPAAQLAPKSACSRDGESRPVTMSRRMYGRREMYEPFEDDDADVGGVVEDVAADGGDNEFAWLLSSAAGGIRVIGSG